MNIVINLGKRDVGTTAVVTVRRFFRTRMTTYVCHQANRLSGGNWIDEATGIAPPYDLQSKLNYAAQAAVQLAANKTRSALANTLGQMKDVLEPGRQFNPGHPNS